MGGSECILTSDELETMSHAELKQRLTTGAVYPCMHRSYSSSTSGDLADLAGMRMATNGLQ